MHESFAIPNDPAGRTFLAGWEQFALLALFPVALAVIELVGAFRTGHGVVPPWLIAISLLLPFLTLRLRLIIGQNDLIYRNWSGARRVRFDDLERATVTVLRHGHTPFGVGVFHVEPRDALPIRINLRTFPIRGAALLFERLDDHGIPIDVSDAWAARRLVDAIRRAGAINQRNA